MITVALIVLTLVTLYLYSTWNFKYWEERGIKHDKPVPLFGTNFKNFTFKISMTEAAVETYQKYPNEKVVGFFRGRTPELVLRDPELIKRVLTTDFIKFYPRGLLVTKTPEPMLENLFFADGDLWKLLRQRMTSSFTSGKLKAMFPLIVERAEKLRSRTLTAAAAGKPLDARELMARYTTDFIGACGFGLDADSLNEEDSEFRKLGVAIFNADFIVSIKAIAKFFMPTLFQRVKLFGEVEKKMMMLVNAIMKERNYYPSGRNDFIDLLMDIKKKGVMEGESVEYLKPDGTPELTSREFDDLLLAAQVFVFFAAGFETSSSATSFTLHQLAYHPEVQEKVQRDIDRVLAKYDGKLCYDAVKEMTYLENAFKEGMRMFPSLGYLIRKCARKFTFPEIDLTIDEGVGIMIPLQALHNDPKYFDNPEEFRPERFEPENFDPNNKYVYLPFGDGPRACIGLRLGLMQSVAGLAAVLSRFTVSPAPNTIRYPAVEPKSSIVQSVKGGLPLLFKERTLTA